MVKKNGTFFLIAFSLISCGDKSGKSLNAPQIEPPVAEATPDGLKTTSTSLNLRSFAEDVLCNTGDTDCFENRALSRLVIRIFRGKEGCSGSAPSDIEGRIRCNLNKIDERMAELDKRAQESEKKCQEEAAQDFSYSFPSGISRTAKFQCAEDLGGMPNGTGTSALAFGLDGGNFYLTETQSTGNVVYSNYNTATNDIEVLIGSHKLIEGGLDGDKSDGSATGGSVAHDGLSALSLMQIKANSEKNSFEISLGANHSMGSGVSCGVRLRSDGTYIYAKGIFAEPDQSVIDTLCSNTEDYLDICLDAKTLDKVDSTNCSSITSFSVSEILPTGFTQAHKGVFGDSSYKDTVTPFQTDAN
ncbi:MAG: hypothetical protein AB8C84_03345 [Oligoflexales bacterium]